MKELLPAIERFKELYPAPSDRRYLVGMCAPISNQFARFCREEFDISEVEVKHYGDCVSFFHAVAVFRNKVIDWTVRQFSDCDEKPYPYIYEIGEGYPSGELK